MKEKQRFLDTMSDPPEKPPNPFLKSATTKGSIFGSQGTTVTSSGLFGGTTATSSVNTFLFGGASAKSPSSDPSKFSNVSEYFTQSATTDAHSTDSAGISAFGNKTSSGTRSAFTNTHSLFGATPTNTVQSVFGGKTVSEAEPETSTAKSFNLFSLPSKPVVNMHSLFGNASSSTEATKINSTSSSSSSVSTPFSSVLSASSSSTTVVSSTSLFGKSHSAPMVSSTSLLQKSFAGTNNNNNNLFHDVVAASKNNQMRQTEHVASHEQKLMKSSETRPSVLSSSSPKRNVLAYSDGHSNPTSFQVKTSNPVSEKLSNSSFSNKPPPFNDKFDKSSSPKPRVDGSSEREIEKCFTENEEAKKIVNPDAYYDKILDLPSPPITDDRFGNSIKAIEPTAIICACVSEGHLDKNILSNHFSKFGTVTNVSLKKMSNQAIVNFTSHESASLARREGKKLHPDSPQMMIFFEYSSKSSPDTANKVRRIKKNAVKFLRQNSLESMTRNRRPSQGSNDDVGKALKDKPYRDMKASVSQVRSRRDDSPAFPPLPHATDNGNRAAKDLDVFIPVVKATNFAALAQVTAFTSQEKYSLLDARDKLIREQQTKILDVRKAQYLSATCSDMCPEKERYMREAQYDLSSYEMTADKKVDHKRTVKKFSRSSADKHEPLPHELRTGAVLKQTMDYLMCNIMPDLEEDSKKDLDLCYNFLWDRTRAMRSDIMQQHLLDRSAVYVLERCVRFHIYCAERLCLEPPDVFDPKMNAEHLSKSLHSLKELYHDLSENSTFVDSESEFRAYEILLDIDDGNIMFAYMNFRDSVRKSPEVQFAVKVLHSIQTNNFVRFFHLVKEATLLQACILHKYFYRVRSKALIILTKAFHAPSRSQSISLSKLNRLLLFESPNDACSFLASHGLSVNTHSRVVLDRKTFIARPRETPPLCRAHHVIGSKKVRSVGEEINGGTLPDNPLLFHQPSNSFSPEGHLTAEALRHDIRKSSLDDASGSILRSTTDHDSTIISSIPYQSSEDCVSEDKTDASLSLDTVAEDTVPCQLTRQHTTNENFVRGPNANVTFADKSFVELGDVKTSVSNSFLGESDKSVFLSQNDAAGEDADVYDGYKVVTYGDEAMFEDDFEGPSLDAFNSVHQNIFGKMADAKVVDDAVNSILGDSYDYNNEEKVRDFSVRKLLLRCFTKWRRVCAENRKIRMLHERLVCRNTIRKWQQFIARKNYERLVLEVRLKLAKIRAKNCFVKWHRFTNAAKISKKNKENRKKFIAQKYFSVWWKKTNAMKWKILRLGDGFPAAPSRLSIAEQNEVWGFNCRGIRCSFSRLYNLEENLEMEKEKYSVRESLSASICYTPLPVQPTFQRFIDSKKVPNTSKPKFFTLVICFLRDVDECVISWLRRKLNPVQNGNPIPINCSYKISSMTTHSHHVIQFVEARCSNISKISGISSVLYISNSATETSCDLARAGGPSPNSKTFVLNKKECSSPSTSLGLVNALVELYKNCAPLRGLHNTSLPQVVNNFISKHVFDVAAQTKRYCNEIGHAPLPPQCYHALYERALLHLKETLLDQRLLGSQWRTLCPETQEPVIREMSESLRRAIADALEQCQFSAAPSMSWTSWSEALKGLITFVKREFDVRPSSPNIGLIEDVSFIVHRTKQMVMSETCGIDSDVLPSTLLLPWKDIYFSLIAHKLYKLPDIDVICFIEDLESYGSDDNWFLPYLVPLKSLDSLLYASKRKAVNGVDGAQCAPKKAKRETARFSLFDDELRKTDELEKRVKEMIEDGDRPFGSLFDNSDSESLGRVSEENTENISESDSSLLNCIGQEKIRFDALEEKILKMIR
ncbi:SAC3/GANP/THP3 [Trinorchestia longiramus]|nr:SAC3/GANP/THP3 [Trinorchestia longiramus]